MKRYLFYILLIIGVSLFTSCSNNEVKEEKSPFSDPITFDLKAIKKRGKLIALTDNSSSSYFIYKGQALGYEYDLLKMFCKYLDVELEIKLVKDLDSIIELLNKGEGDLIACNYTITSERAKFINFAQPYTLSRQVLIQKKPEGWKRMSKKELNSFLIMESVELDNKDIHIRKGSSFNDRLVNLSEEIGGKINIIHVPGDMETEELIKKVATGKILYTIADENVAKLNQSYYNNIDVSVPISVPQKIAWATRKNAPDLMDEINKWLAISKDSRPFRYTYQKYFEMPKNIKSKVISEYSSLGGGKISEYDDLIRQYSDSLGWDWRLLASLIYQESKFNHHTKSWAGAKGIMQLMPATAQSYGINESSSIEENIAAGVKILNKIQSRWRKTISDEGEVIKFTLASYNVGTGHVIDAINLTKKYKKDSTKWEDNVVEYLKLKAKAEYYTDKVVQHGYCRGSEPSNYVKNVLDRYNSYISVIQ